MIQETNPKQSHHLLKPPEMNPIIHAFVSVVLSQWLQKNTTWEADSWPVGGRWGDVILLGEPGGGGDTKPQHMFYSLCYTGDECAAEFCNLTARSNMLPLSCLTRMLLKKPGSLTSNWAHIWTINLLPPPELCKDAQFTMQPANTSSPN